MGFYSWITSDTGRSIPNIYSERETFPVYLLCPDGSAICEPAYAGYGQLGGRYAYELAAEWNREHLTTEMLEVPERECYAADEEGERCYLDELERYASKCRRLLDYRGGTPHEEMAARYGESYLYEIGVDIACSDRRNASLPYPIKIVEDPSIGYADAAPSAGCPDQGFFY